MMKLLFKLLLTLLGFFSLLGLLWLSLPTLLAVVAESQLSQYGYEKVEVEIGEVTLHAVTVERLKMSNAEMDIAIDGIQASFDLTQLLAGKLTSILVKAIEIHRLSTDTATPVLPDPALLSSILLTPWQQDNPAEYISLEKVTLYDTGGNLSFTASIEISKQGETTRAEVNLRDSKAKKHSLLLLVSAGRVDLQWKSPESEVETPVSVQIKPMADASGLTGQASINLSAIQDVAPELGGLSGKIQAKFSYLGKVDSDEKDISIRANIIDIAIADSEAKSIQLSINALLTEKDGGINLQFLPSSTVKLLGLRQGKNSVKKVSIALPRTLRFTAASPFLEKKNGAEITISDAELDNIKIPKLEIKNFSISAKKATKSQVDCRFSMQLILPVLIVDDIKLRSKPYSIVGTCPGVDSSVWSIKSQNDSIEADGGDFNISLAKCKVTAKSADDGSLDKISGDATCENNTSSGRVNTQFAFNSSQGAGYADYSFSKIKPDNERPLFSSLLKDWQQPFDIVSGTVSAKGRYRWWKNKKNEDKERLSMEVDIEKAGGYYEGVLFSGLNYKDHIKILPYIKSSSFARLSIKNIDVGIPITAFSTEILLNKSRNGPLPLVKLNGLSFSLLDGKIKGNGLQVDMNSDRHDVVLIVEGLDLAQIVELQKIDGLAATGRLDGYIPVTITDEGIKITDGKIVAQKQGGYIHYRPAGGTSEMAQSAIGSEFVFRIIQDLDYNSLTIDVDYDEDGEMIMQFAIKGISPKVDKLRPIHFNLNLQQNVLKLLKGLRYADGLSKGIDKNVQKLFRKQKNPVN